MEEKEKSEFMLATEAFAKEIANLTNKDGVKRGIVILASEDLGDETAQAIAVAGNGMEAIKLPQEMKQKICAARESKWAQSNQPLKQYGGGIKE